VDLGRIAGLLLAAGATILVRFTGQGNWAGALAGFIVAALAVLGFGPGALFPLATFVFGSGILTRVGRSRKESAGMAEPNRGRRDVRHVLAKLGIPAILAAIAIVRPAASATLALAYVAALAGAFADTAATETGPLAHGPVVAWRGAKLERVDHGTTGGVSALGFLASIVGALAVGLGSIVTGLLPLPAAAIAAGAGWIAAAVESMVGGFTAGRALGHFGRNVLVSAIATALGVTAGACGWGKP
jgi:uncharacterized protein (TIGR00297 family)